MGTKLEKAFKVLRKALHIKPYNTQEEWERLIWLKKMPRARKGQIKWQKNEIHYKDGYVLHEQLNEVFLQKQYDFKTDKDNPILIDCGAHVGLVSLRWRQLFPSASITAIEADPEIGILLEANLASAGFENVRVIKKAVWVDDNGVKFNQSGLDNGNVDLNGKSGITVASVDLASIIAEEVDFLKMDIEGAEYKVLQRLSDTKKLSNISRIVIEFHHWNSDINPLPEALHLLQKNGFDSRIVSSVLFKKRTDPVFSGQGWVHSHVVVAAKNIKTF